jgi:hypothetical protein
MTMETNGEKPGRRKLVRRKGDSAAAGRGPQLPNLFQVVVECRDEAEQRELYERMRGEGRRVRLLVL